MLPADGRVPVTFFADIQVNIGGAVTQLIGEGLAGSIQHIPDENLRAFFNEQAYGRLTHTSRATGDNCYLSC